MIVGTTVQTDIVGITVVIIVGWEIPKGRLKKKPGLFNDIDQIAFNTHPPPPKDDIWKND